MEANGYSLVVKTALSMEDAISKVTAALAAEGFGILTEIDVQATLKKKLDIDTKPYKILGACNPGFANRAVGAAPLVGVFMPCNVVVWDDGSERVIAAMDPGVMPQIIEGVKVLEEVAIEAQDKLKRALASVG